MLRNYFKIAIRNLLKNKTFSLVNIFGLSIGMACCMTILLWVQHERSYDKHQERAEDLYRVWTTLVSQDGTTNFVGTPTLLAPNLKQDFPEIQTVTRILPFGASEAIIQLKNSAGAVQQSLYEPYGCLADSTFFDIFKYNFIEGNPKTALNQPNTVVISEEIAQKLFPNQSAINQVIYIKNNNGDNDFQITGVFKPSKAPSHLEGRYFMSMYTGPTWGFMQSETNMLNNNFLYTYVRLHPGADSKALEQKLPAFIQKHIGKELENAGMRKEHHLQPVTDIHLRSHLDYEFGQSGSITSVYILASLALLTLLIACINFMNLSTARSSKRAVEVGIRKVMGAEKTSLVRQFVSESVLLSFLAFIIAIVMVELLLPIFNQLTDKELSLFSQPEGLLWFVGIALVTGFLAGSYPAFYLSSFNPTEVLKRKLNNSLSVVALRKGLVVFQFIISIGLIITSLFINKQINFLKDSNLGFEQERQITIPLRTETAKQNAEVFKIALLQQSGVSAATAASSYPGTEIIFDRKFYTTGKTSKEGTITPVNFTDFDYAKTLQLQLVAGRFFSKDFPADTSNRLVLNEMALRKLGFTTPESAVGQSIYMDGTPTKFELIGVIKDFHFESLHTPIRPYGIMFNSAKMNIQPNYLVAHLNTDNVGNLLSRMEQTWKTFNPEDPFIYSFLKDNFQRKYESEQQVGTLIRYFTVFAIFISCLGLFGLAAFTAEQRTKEIGIRKVLGASVGSIVTLLSKEFLLLVGIAIILATPIAWYAANRWLENFAYRIHIQWSIFIIAGVIALLIALFTIGFQAIRAAVANPVDSLKNE